MARPSDWWVLDLDADPTPGAPDRLNMLGRRFLDFAETANRARRSVESLRGDDTVLTWVGLSGDAFREQFGEFPEQLRKLYDSHQMAGDALHEFAPKLETAQAQADRALADGRVARDRLATVSGQLTIAQGDFAAISKAATDLSGAAAPDPEQVRQATRNAESAQQRLASTQSAVNSAQQALDAAKSLAEQARQVRDTAARECAREIDAASEVGIQPRSFWQKLGDAFKALWDVICEVAKWVALVAGVIAMIIGGPLAWVALAAGAILLIKAIVDFAQGKGSVADLIFGILGVIPGVKGLTSLSKLSSLYKAGGLKEIGKAALTGMKDMAKTMVTTVKNLGKGAVNVVKSGFGKLAAKLNDLPLFTSKPSKAIPSCGDPIDVSTGRMFLTDTDLERPGTPPLLLIRSHRSDYRAGRCFGPTWSSTLDQRVQVEGDLAHVVAADGMLLTYPLPHDDTPVLPGHGAELALSCTPHGEFLLTDPRTRNRMVFAAPDEDGTAPLVALIEPAGARMEVVRDPLGVPIEVRHSDGYRVAVESNDAGLVTALCLAPGEGAVAGEGAVPGADGRTPTTLREFGYDEHGRLTEVVNSSGAATRYEYDDAGRIVGWTDSNGMSYRYTYDTDGRCVQAEGRDGYLNYRLSYDTANGITRATDSLGHTRTYQLNERLQVVAETDPLGATTHSEWDARDRLLSRTDPLGRTTRLHYDEDGNVASVTRPDGSTVLLEYGDPWCKAVLAGDGYRVVAAEVVVGDAVWRRAYEETEAPDPATGPVGTALPLRVEEVGQHDRPADPTDAEQRQYDGEVEYDGEGNETAYIDPVGQVSRTEYAGFDLAVASVDPTGARTTYEYDTEMRLTAVTSPQGLVWRFTYDPAGRLVRECDFDGRVSEYSFDAAGQLVRSVNALGEVVEYRYDLLGNLVERLSPAGPTTFEYDPVGRLVRATSPDAVLIVERDDEGRVTAETVNGRTVSLAYDEVNRTVRRRTPSGAHSVWAYDRAGLPSSLQVAGQTLRFDHDPAGRETRRLGDRFALTQGYESGHGLTSQVLTRKDVLTRQDATVQRRDYAYRPDGALVGVDDQLGGPVRFSLDAAGRVTEVTGPDRTERYRYDPVGDLTGSTVTGTGGTPASVSTSDGEWIYQGTRLVRAGAVSYRYDAAGRLVAREDPDASGAARTWQFRWDADDRLTGVTTPDGARWRYRYDPLGRRISKQRLAKDTTMDTTVDAVADATVDTAMDTVVEQVDFAWHGPVLVEAAHTSGDAEPRVLVWEHHPYDDRPVTQTAHRGDTVEQVAMVVTDLVGAPAELVDADGCVVWRARASLWGQSASAPVGAVDTPLRFPGQYHDPETDLHYNVYRFYDPANGRYTSPDPLGLGPGPNPVAYVSNPLGAVDPLGLAKCTARGGGPIRHSSRIPRPSPMAQRNIGDTLRRIARDQASAASANRLEELRGLNANLVKRTLAQGGGASWTAKLNRYSHIDEAGGTHFSDPAVGAATDVNRLNNLARSHGLSNDLTDALKAAGLQNNERWIKGHLFNDKLGGPGISENLTPLTDSANKIMSQQIEGPLKRAADRFRQDPNGGAYGIDFKVSVSDNLKFPNSTNRAEQSIRDFLEFDLRYTGLSNADIARLNLPELPPPGTRLDTISGQLWHPNLP
jgi:RHS repeat-associated protein